MFNHGFTGSVIALCSWSTASSIAASIPAGLKAIPQWVTWRYEPGKDSKPTKVPYTPGTNQRASTTDPATWRSFDAALAGMNGCDGVGLVVTESSGLVMIDLDHTGENEIAIWAQRILERCHSYAERSPSGAGIHIIVKATLPPGARKRGQVEMYDRARFSETVSQKVFKPIGSNPPSS